MSMTWLKGLKEEMRALKMCGQNSGLSTSAVHALNCLHYVSCMTLSESLNLSEHRFSH